MSSDRTKILDKAKKLKELADRGVDGEQVNAKDMLEKYMAKHNISIDEIGGHNISGSIYANMSQEEFYKEMVSDLIIVGLDLLFFNINGNKSKFKEHRDNSLNNLADKYNLAINERINKHKK